MKILKLSVLLYLSSVSGLSFADNFFQTPSGNIVCQGSDTEVTCLIGSGEKTIHTTCGGADTFIIGKNSSKVKLVCGGDAGDDKPKTINYGKSISGNGWKCASDTTGMICKNNKNHGFNLNRSQQHIF